MAKRSNAATGSYYKARTQKWLEAGGYVVALLERMLVVHRPGRPLYVKRDQLGCDLLAVNASGVRFVQVKFCGTDDRRNRDQKVPEAWRELAKHPCPPGAKQWLLIWTRGARYPEVQEGVRDDSGRLTNWVVRRDLTWVISSTASTQQTPPPARRRATKGTATP